MTERIATAERRLGKAALQLDNVVREYRRSRRRGGAREEHLMFGCHKTNMAAYEELDAAMKHLRSLTREGGVAQRSRSRAGIGGDLMGFFSWKCNGCDRSIMAPFDLPPEQTWMSKAVAILPDGTKREGDYDGYGRIDGESIVPETSEQPGLWHERCYDGQEYGPSTGAEDQGYVGFQG